MGKSKIRFDIVTLFPDFFKSPLQTSLLGKAVEKGIIEINLVDLRDFGLGKHQSVDDTPYGGGAGMIMRVDVLAEAVKNYRNSTVILLDPSGKKFNQALAKKLSKKSQLVLVCGRYEGVDQRFKDLCVDEEISIGDYVLNGGETAAWVIVEALSRLVPGVLGRDSSSKDESFNPSKTPEGRSILLEYPQFTKPALFQGKAVPKILLSGDHKKIEEWRKREALQKTKKLRPDLLN